MGRNWTEKIMLGLLAAGFLSGCGIKGGLYIPSDQPGDPAAAENAPVVSVYNSGASTTEAAPDTTDGTSGASGSNTGK